MRLTLEEICRKEVVNITDGTCFGYADDIIIDTETREVVSIIIRGKPRFFRFFGNEEGFSINWNEIENIGKDTILVKTEKKVRLHKENENFFQKILDIFFNI